MPNSLLLCLATVLSILQLVLCANVTSSAGFDPKETVVVLEVVNATSHDVVQEAEDSTEIQLRASLSQGDNIAGVSLYNCKAASEDGTTLLQLSDAEGCPTKRSPMGCMKKDANGTVVSPVFSLSSLGDAGHVNITCCWEICMTPSDLKCVDRCGYFAKTKHSKGSSEKTEKSATKKMPHMPARPRRDEEDVIRMMTSQNHVSTSIRVLPSHVRRGPRRHHHRHHGNSDSATLLPGVYTAENEVPFQENTVFMKGSTPLLYLNPITCSIFLLILAVFLGLYVSFIRSLRHSVDVIRQEIEAQRSRDKFLVH